MEAEITNRILKLLKISRIREWRPWELQTELKKVDEDVISVGDDLSFTLRLEKKLEIDERALTKLKAKKTKIYPFKKAYRFEKGYVAVDDRFIRISRNLEPEKLTEVLLCMRYVE